MSGSVVSSLASAPGRARPGVSSTSSSPRAPQTVEDSGLTRGFLIDLLAKFLLLRGRSSLTNISLAIRLPPSVLIDVLGFMRSEHLVEVRGGANESEAQYQLSESGKHRGNEALARSQYAGVAPVALDDYHRVTRGQSIAGLRFTSEAIHDALRELVLPETLVDQLGAAMNSGRAVLLYGPAGSGKTFLAERFAELLPGEILVPYAITVGGEVIQVFDPLVHDPIAPTGHANAFIKADADERWVACRRPVVMTGGELTLSMLDLQFDLATRFYQAPPHIKANGGLLIIDDLGRQLVEPRQLMNRWIVPLDRQRDYLSLHTGFKFEVPFEVLVLFSTNLRPTDLADEAFLRRFGYKVFVGPLSLGEYQRVFENVCREVGVTFSRDAFDWLIEMRHGRDERPLLACYPRDLLGRVRDFSIYDGSPSEMTASTLDRAWRTYFVTEGG